MSEGPGNNLSGLEIELARQIDAVCRQFEADRRGHEPFNRRLPGWRPRGGPRGTPGRTGSSCARAGPVRAERH